MQLEEAVVLLTAAFVCFCVMYPLRFRVMFHRGLSRLRLRLDFATASVCGVLFLHFVDIISLQQMLDSLWAVGHVQPLAVLVIFFTLAYASISLDVTGFSRFIALTVLGGEVTDQPQSKNQNGEVPTHKQLCQPSRRLLLEVYLLSGIIALIASNDVVILTLTPVLLHFCDGQRIAPHRVVFIEYVAANTWSAFLLIGNPTNIIAGQAMQMTFARYLMLLWMPTTVVVVTTMVVVYLTTSPDNSNGKAVDDDTELTRVPPLMAGSPPLSSTSLQQKEGTVHAAVSEELALSTEVVSTSLRERPAVADLMSVSIHFASPIPPPPHVTEADRVLEELCHSSFAMPVQHMPAGPSGPSSTAAATVLADPVGARVNGAVLGVGVIFLIICGYTPIPMFAVTSITCGIILVCDCFRVRTNLMTEPLVKNHDEARAFCSSLAQWWKRSRVSEVAQRMPWAVAPFAASMFILVDALSKRGVTAACSAVVVSQYNELGSFWATMLMMLAVVVAMNLLNNQPATILLSVILLEASYAPSTTDVGDAVGASVLDGRQSTAAFVALSLGSNIAAVFTPKGALAGILWESILSHHGVSFSAWMFFKMGLIWMALPVVFGGVASIASAILFQ